MTSPWNLLLSHKRCAANLLRGNSQAADLEGLQGWRELTEEVKATSWRAVINDCPPSANPFLRSHFRVRAELKEKFCVLLWEAFSKSGIRKAAGKRKVKLFIRSTRQRDVPNNYLTADKLILDNLVLIGWLKDDSPKWLELEIIHEIGKPQTIIEISEIGGGGDDLSTSPLPRGGAI